MLQAVMKENAAHTPVLVEEIMTYLNPVSGDAILDCTLGLGGHASHIMQYIGADGRLIGLDRDQAASAQARTRLEDFLGRLDIVHTDYADLDQALKQLGIDGVDGILIDAGVSSMQLDTAERGFSFREDGPLDMRMDQTAPIRAYDLVNTLSEYELAHIIREYGEDRWHKKIARHIVEARALEPIYTTRQLADVVANAIPKRFHEKRIHPATRTFQGLRIAVNHELDSLKTALEKAVLFLKPGARLCVISFHSLEDRIVKHAFRSMADAFHLNILTKKPIVPSEVEMEINPRARSAKLRVVEKAV